MVRGIQDRLVSIGEKPLQNKQIGTFTWSLFVELDKRLAVLIKCSKLIAYTWLTEETKVNKRKNKILY